MASVDILTLAEAKRALNLSGDTQNAELQAYITAVSLRLDGLCGPVISRTVSSESHDGGCAAIFLRQYPVLSVTSVVEFDNTTPRVLSAETSTTKTANDYRVDARIGRIRRRSSNSVAVFPAEVVVTYTAGRYLSTSSASENFKTSAAIMLSNLWRKEQGAGTVTFGEQQSAFVPWNVPLFSVPNAVRELLSDEMLGPRVG